MNYKQWLFRALGMMYIFLMVLLWFPASNAWSKDAWRDAAHVCKAPDGFEFASKGPETSGDVYPGDCQDADSVLFNGLLCASGDAHACDVVRHSATLVGGNPEDIAFWRSPRRAQNNNYHLEGTQRHPYVANNGAEKTFSRDQNLGVLLYAVTTRDAGILEGWFNRIANYRHCITYKPFSDDCWERGIVRYCADEQCMLKPLDRDIDDAVFSAVVGHAPPDGIYNYYAKSSVTALRLLLDAFIVPLGTSYLSASVGQKIFLEVDIDNPLISVPENFPTHLNAIRAWLLLKIGHPDAGIARAAIGKIARHQPRNPFYQYLNEGITPHTIALVKEACPTPGHSRAGNRQHWAWESSSKEWITQDSMLWDCIFMRNLLGDQGKTLGISHRASESAVSNLLLQ